MRKTVCKKCDKLISKDEVALNKKLLVKSNVAFLCVDCLAEYLGATSDDLKIKIIEFKDQGCVHFA